MVNLKVAIFKIVFFQYRNLHSLKPLVLSEDFRQSIPVIRKGTKVHGIQACLVQFSLWGQVIGVQLSQRNGPIMW